MFMVAMKQDGLLRSTAGVFELGSRYTPVTIGAVLCVPYLFCFSGRNSSGVYSRAII